MIKSNCNFIEKSEKRKSNCDSIARVEKRNSNYNSVQKSQQIKNEKIDEKKVEREIMKLEISYNPYLINTKFKIDNSEIRSDSDLNKFADKRIQLWIKELKNVLKKEFVFKKLEIKFKGRTLDYQDLLNYYENSENISLKHFPIIESEERLNKLKNLFKKIQKGPYEELKRPEVKEYFEKTFSSEFEIGVIATMSSGKSTLLNAIIGEELMPSKAQACTAKISKIYDDKTKSVFSAKIISNEKIIKEIDVLNSEDLKELNDDENVDLIEIRGNIENIHSNENQLVLIDTPGPNNANDIKHKNLTYGLIKKDYRPLILYILNYQQLGINDDKNLLEYIGEEIKKSGDLQSSQRFIFVLNRVDSIFENENDDPIEKTIENIKEYLLTVGIENPIIIPVSAFTALLIRGGYNKENKKLKRIKENKIADFCEAYEEDNLNINNYMNISPSIINKINTKLKKESDEEKQAEYLTGLPALEEYINEYLTKYAAPEKIKKASDTFVNFIKKEELENKIFDEMKKSQDQLKIWKTAINEIEKKYKEDIPNIRKRLSGMIDLIKKNMDKKIESYEIMIENTSNKIKKTKSQEDSDKNNAMKNVKNYINELQNEYTKLRVDMDQDVSKTLKDEVNKLSIFYGKEVAKISGKHIDKNLSQMITNVLKLDIASQIQFDENKLEDILQKTRT
ncbi:MAG: dynamin family protein [Cetobacterium sp.]